jgi:hypothetical protein
MRYITSGSNVNDKGTTSGIKSPVATKLGLVENCNRAAIGLDTMTYAPHAPLNIECWNGQYLILDNQKKYE